MMSKIIPLVIMFVTIIAHPFSFYFVKDNMSHGPMPRFYETLDVYVLDGCGIDTNMATTAKTRFSPSEYVSESPSFATASQLSS